jgi:hypothetical protein
LVSYKNFLLCHIVDNVAAQEYGAIRVNLLQEHKKKREA